MPLRLAILEPGHFHAALALRRANPRLDPTVRVYAGDGPELERFLALVGRFNDRAGDPAGWRLEVHRSGDPMGAMLAARATDVAVLAGRNRGKLARIRALVEAGIHVLADKPWVVDPEDVRHLDALAAAPAHWADMMTERHEPWSALFADLARSSAAVGRPDRSRGPALTLSTLHHLAKEVDGAPLLRPAWYFDVSEQGEGLVDVTTHLVDRALLIAGAAERPLSAEAVRLLQARRWATSVDEASYREITAGAGFPPGLAGRTADGLQLMANGELDFACGDLTVRVRAEWRLRASDRAGDRHAASFHGTRADIALAGDGAGTRLRVRPHGDGAAVAAAIAAAGVASERDGDGLLLRPLRTGSHEACFAEVLEGFLAGLARPQPAWERAAIVARYRLLAGALAVARAGAALS